MSEIIEKQFSENDSIYNVWRENNLEKLDNGDNSAIDYFGEKTTFNEAYEKIDEYAHAFSALRESPESSVTFSTVTLPSTMMGFFALNKMGVRANFVAEPVLRSDGKTYLDDTNTETIMVLDNFYATLAPAIAQTNVKNIVIMSMLDGVGDPEEIARRVKLAKPELKDVPTDYIIQSMRGSYGKILEAGKIPGKEYYNIEEFLENGYKKSHGEIENNYTPNDTAVVLYTGGSTGVPKGVERTNEATIAMVNTLTQPGVSVGHDMKKQRNCVTIPPNHPTNFVHGFSAPWVLGAEQVLQPVYNIHTLPDDVSSLNINYAVAAPDAYLSFQTTDLPDDSLSQFNFPYSGGGPLSYESAIGINKAFRRLGVPTPLIHCWGMSETGPLGLSPEIGNWDLANKVGKPLPGMDARIVDENGDVILGANVRGKLEIKADYTKMKQYFNMPEKTAEFWTEDGFGKTEDIVVRDKDGNYDVLGRGTDMYIDKYGETQYLFDLENFIYTHHAVLEAEATKIEDANGVVPLAHVVLKPEFRDKSDEILVEIKSMCEDKFSGGAVPRGIKFHESFPTNPISNKRDYVLLGKVREGFMNCDEKGIYRIDFPEDSSTTMQYTKIFDD